MKKSLISVVTAAVISCTVPLGADAVEVVEGVEFSGYVKNETAYRITGDDNWMKIRDEAGLKMLYSPTDYLSAFVNLRYYYDSVYDANNEYSDQAAHEYRHPREEWDWLRDCYADYTSDLLDIRLGKQTIVWGTADGVKVLDLVNPMDMREFTLAPFVDSRIPQWTAKAEISPTLNSALQLFVIPLNFEPNLIPVNGAPFTFRATRVGDIAKARLASMGYTVNNFEDEPSDSLNNSKFGVRWQDVVENLSYSLNYMQGYSMSSVVNVETDMSTAIGDSPAAGMLPVGSTYNFTKQYPYIRVMGASCSYGINDGALEGLTVRSEFAYTRGDECGFGEDSSQKGLTDVDHYNYVMGLDKYFFIKYLFSFQLIQMIDSKSEATDPRSGLSYPLLNGATYHPREQVETMLSLKISTQYFWDRLKPEIMLLYGQHGDWRISPQASYELTDDLVMSAGAHIMTGSDTTLFGQFSDNKEIFMTMRYGF